MEIELKNGEKLVLEVTPLLLEYIEDYKGFHYLHILFYLLLDYMNMLLL